MSFLMASKRGFESCSYSALSTPTASGSSIEEWPVYLRCKGSSVMLLHRLNSEIAQDGRERAAERLERSREDFVRKRRGIDGRLQRDLECPFARNTICWHIIAFVPLSMPFTLGTEKHSLSKDRIERSEECNLAASRLVSQAQPTSESTVNEAVIVRGKP